MKKLTPIFILGIFVIGMYFILQGMNKAVAMSKSKVEIKK